MITSVLILFACALLCLILESLGVKAGERKTGRRTYIVLIAVAGILGAAFYLPTQLVFGVCTFRRAETTDVVRSFLESHPDFTPGPGGYLGPGPTDGFFMQAFERKG